MKTQEALQVQVEGARDVIGSYVSGDADPGEGLLAHVDSSDHGVVRSVSVRWQARYGEGGVTKIDQASWLLGLAMLGRTLQALKAVRAETVPVNHLTMGMTSDHAVATGDGFAVWLSQTYEITLDRYTVIATVTWTGKEPTRAQ